jgi:hypothetical protein
MAKDLRAQERGNESDLPRLPRLRMAPGTIHCAEGMHPDHDEATVFTAGQLLPDWVAKALAEQRPWPNELSVYVLRNTGKRGNRS